jgi:hypothetical protein
MVEPEMAFCNLECNMDLAEELVKYLTTYVMEECKDDLALFAKFVDRGLMATLENTAFSDYVRLPYAEAVDILSKSGKKFEYEIVFGNELQSEHERFLTEKHFKKPVIVFDYPKGIKPFYMRLNHDNTTVAAMDVLVPSIGEIIGGSQREERLDVLVSRLEEMGLSKTDYWWYIEARYQRCDPVSQDTEKHRILEAKTDNIDKMVLAFANNIFYQLLQMLDPGCWMLDTRFSMIIEVSLFFGLSSIRYPVTSICMFIGSRFNYCLGTTFRRISRIRLRD